jgi:hypothetical protein
MSAKKAPSKKLRSGKPTNVYLGEADIKRLRKLAAWLMERGQRVSDSQTIKAALIVARRNGAFLQAFQQVLDADLRYRKS